MQLKQTGCGSDQIFFSDQTSVFFPNKGGLRQLFSFSSALMDYAYGYPAMDKRRAPGRPSLQDYLKLAALQYELDSEEAENEIVPNEGMYAVISYFLICLVGDST